MKLVVLIRGGRIVLTRYLPDDMRVELPSGVDVIIMPFEAPRTHDLEVLCGGEDGDTLYAGAKRSVLIRGGVTTEVEVLLPSEG